MIRSFSAENFYSIGVRQAIDLAIRKDAKDPDSRFLVSGDQRYPSVVGFFGPNGAGKTSLLRVPRFISYFIADSFVQKPDSKIIFTPFLSSDFAGKPTKLSISFDLPDGERSIPYFYELELTQERVLFEKLEYSPKGKRRKLFTRDGEAISPGPDFHLAKDDPIMKKVRKNASVISTFAQFNHDISVQIQHRASLVISNLNFFGRMDLPDEEVITDIYGEYDFAFEKLREFIQDADVGIEDISLEEYSPAKETDDVAFKPMFRHEGLQRELELFEESHGTRNLYKVLGLILPVMHTGSIVILDDLDSDLHPLLITKVLSLFHFDRSNPHKAQIFFSGHNPYTLTALEKEEIYFVEKDDSGQSSTFGLREIEGVRRTDNFLSKYLSGQYGAIPKV